MKPLQIFVVGAMPTILVFFLEFFMGWVALGIAVLPAVLVLAGHVFIPTKVSGMSVTMNLDLFLFDDVPAELPHNQWSTGNPGPILGPLMKHIQFRIERWNFWLPGVGLLCLSP